MNDLYREIFDNLAIDYDTKTKDNWQSPIIIQDILLKFINKDSRILDIGIGTGQSCIKLLENNDVYGMDMSYKMLQQARNRRLNLNLVQSDFREGIPFRNDAFDICICCGVFEFIRDFKFGLEEMIRVVNHQGLILFTSEIQEKSELIEICEGYTIYRRNETEIENIIETLRLKIIYKEVFKAYKSIDLKSSEHVDIMSLCYLLRK